MTTTKVPTVRMPGRVWFYISGTGWYQGEYHRPDGYNYPPGEIEFVDRMIQLIDGAKVRSDESRLIPIADEETYLFMRKEGEYAFGNTKGGDNTPDDIADRCRCILIELHFA